MTTEHSQAEGVEGTPRVIGGIGALAIVAGSMLGIGIFLAPPIVAQHLPAPAPFFAIWILAALAALSGAVAMAELGVTLPRAGGDYVFQREAFGPSVAFASGWVLFGAIFTGSVAALAVPVCQYQLPVLLDPITAWLLGPGWSSDLGAPVLFGVVTGRQLVAVGLVLGFTVINAVGAKLSSWAQTAMTVVPIAILTVGAVWALAGGAAPPSPEALIGPESAFGVVDWTKAYMAVYFAFAGWNAVVYVAGEVKSPARNIPIGLIGGTVLIALLYLLLNGAFLEVLGMGGLATAFEAGTATAGALGGDLARLVVTSLIAIALLASLNGTILQGARVAFAMAHGAALPRFFGATNGAGVPGRALWFQAAWACVLILSGTFEQLLSLVSIAMMLCGSLTVASLFVVRHQRAGQPRAYSALGYPVLPAFYLLSSLAVVVVTVIDAVSSQKLEGWFPLFGVGLMLAALIGHLVVTSVLKPKAARA